MVKSCHRLECAGQHAQFGDRIAVGRQADCQCWAALFIAFQGAGEAGEEKKKKSGDRKRMERGKPAITGRVTKARPEDKAVWR